MALERMGRRNVRRGELTPAEIKAAADEAVAGGFSRRITGTGAGRPARDVFATGVSSEGRAGEVPVSARWKPQTQVARFVKNKSHVWAQRGADWLLGGWRDPETNRVVMDTSVATPRTSGGMEAAMQMGAYYNQEAIGNLGKTGYEGDVAVPAHISRDQFYKNRGVSAPEVESIEPTVTNLGLVESSNPASGQPQMRERIRIEPSRLEQVQVEAGEVARKMGLKDKK